MSLAFVLLAGALALGAALLLLLPLLRRRAESEPSAIAAVAVLVLLLLGGAALYRRLSSFDWAEAPPADTPATMTAKLARELAADPNHVDKWLLLAQSYRVLGQEPLALRAYQRADRLANGQNADALMGMAEVLVQENPESLRDVAGRLFERALAADPRSQKAMFYAGFAALGRGESALARDRFNAVLATDLQPEARALVQRALAGMDTAGNAAQGAAAPADGARVLVHVTLAPALAGKVPADAQLFVAARDPAQPGPPFAAKRLPARFPVDVELSAADAMLPARRIAAGQTLEVVARVALGGTPTATRGDPYGQVGYHVGKDGRLNIVIDRLAP